jgi:glutaredoxin
MKVEIYTMENCGYCQESKKLLDENNYSYTEHMLTDENANVIVKQLQERLETEHIIVPVIFIDNTSLIGHFSLVDFIENKKNKSRKLT